MTNEQIRDLMQDFRAWSGGMAPDSEEEVFIYVEYGRNNRFDQVEVIQFLDDWMGFAWEHDEMVSNPRDDEPAIVATPEQIIEWAERQPRVREDEF